MIRKILLFSFCCFLFLQGEAQQPDKNLGIIPAPASVTLKQGTFVTGPSSNTVILFENPQDEKTAGIFRDFMKMHYGLDMPVKKKRGKIPANSILFSSAGFANPGKEAYRLAILPDRITVQGKEAGLFYGLQSLMQLFPLKKTTTFSIPCAEIADEPRYPYRGMMLGVSYHIFPVGFIKELIDLMAEYKLNRLHWHLTDDNGWRIEIKKYPLLTKVGAWRKETQIGHDGGALDGKRYGGYYTQDQIREIVAYAAQRYITIIPEIEMPGHCLAALASYPWLGCSGGPYQVATQWGIYKDVYCPTDTTFKFLEDVLTEVMDLFPSHYIHIGGDECPKDSWKQSAFCQQLMKEKGLKNEEELQSYFIRRMEKFLNSKGRDIIGWDEILEGGLAPNATVESWRGTDGGIASARQHHDVIMAPTDYVYFDYLQGKEEEEPIAIGGYNPLLKVYSYNPTPSVLTPEQQKYIQGVEACIWTEFIPTPAKVEYMILPRMMALSEIAWTPLDRKDYTSFSTLRLPEHLARMDTSGVIYRVPQATGIKDTTLYGSRFRFTLKPSVTGAAVYYTLDGYKPDQTTFLYEQPLSLVVPEGQKRVLKTIVITPSGKRSRITTTVLDNISQNNNNHEK